MCMFLGGLVLWVLGSIGYCSIGSYWIVLDNGILILVSIQSAGVWYFCCIVSVSVYCAVVQEVQERIPIQVSNSGTMHGRFSEKNDGGRVLYCTRCLQLKKWNPHRQTEQPCRVFALPLPLANTCEHAATPQTCGIEELCVNLFLLVPLRDRHPLSNLTLDLVD